MAVPGPHHCLLLLCLLCRAISGQKLLPNGVNGFSLHPPYFNLAEGTKISATATCGEGEDGRPVEDLYCKLVGGPVLGDPSQTIQVHMGLKPGLCFIVSLVPLLSYHCYFVSNFADLSLSLVRGVQGRGWVALYHPVP